jgi:hypothetical protein
MMGGLECAEYRGTKGGRKRDIDVTNRGEEREGG